VSEDILFLKYLLTFNGRHPKPAVLLLDTIFARRISANQSGHASEQGAPCPQLVLASATLRNHLKEYALIEKGWLRKDRTTKVIGSGLIGEFPAGEDHEEATLRELGGTGITHCALVISKNEGVRNISGAVRALEVDVNYQEAEAEEKELTLPDVLSSAPDAVIDEDEDILEGTRSS
jgi:hypothetical protein